MSRRRIATVTIVFAIASALGLATAGSAVAATNLQVNGGWHIFDFGAAGSGASGQPYTFVAPTAAVLEVTDGFEPGDQFAVYDNGVLLGNTSVVPVSGSYCSNPDTCFADSAFSHGTFNLPIGLHSITIVTTVSPFGGGAAWLRVDAPVACDTTITGTHGAVTATSGTTCIVNATVTGGVSVAQGASLFVLKSTISGSISAHATPYFAVCGSKTGSIGVSAATGPVVIGDPASGCAGNTISGSVTAANNTGGLTIEHNKITGSITASGNTSPVVISGNTH